MAKGHHGMLHGHTPPHMVHHPKRARGGETKNREEKPEDTDTQEHEFLKDSETPGKKHGGHHRKRGGHHEARKHGGHVEGKKAEHRPDRRARGGATSDLHPESSAGRMSAMPFERHQAANRTEGAGPDRD